MVSQQLLARIRSIELQSRHILSGGLVGNQRSTFKGSGFEFDQLREYFPGDDIRFVDWKSSSRLNTLVVKQYIEERQRTVMLFVDVSSSSSFGSGSMRKADLMAQVAGVLAMLADHARDRVTLVLFSDTIEKVIPPGRGKAHVYNLIKMLDEWCQQRTSAMKKTSIAAALSYLRVQNPRDALVFLLSDFIDQNFEHMLKTVSRRYEIIAIRCLDRNECQFPSVGFLQVEDSETGERLVIDTRSGSRKHLGRFLEERQTAQEKIFRQARVDSLTLTDPERYADDLIHFFRRRIV